MTRCCSDGARSVEARFIDRIGLGVPIRQVHRDLVEKGRAATGSSSGCRSSEP
ncbi:hypothetical protein YT1_0114 [Rhodococcus ruber]|nr:hypothetical protein YT1_0114 [Rhodococcus ruber]